ncbi:MAG TPA: hypothetical protein VMB82_13120 [Acidimicrobiales bacterium]|nr:hypothetical protein [Acidimicrobiales bacterium]
MAAKLWTLIGFLGGGLVAFFVDARAGWRQLAAELRTEVRTGIGALRAEFKDDLGEARTECKAHLNGLRDEVHVLAERPAEMNARFDVVVSVAQTHPPAAGSPG